jgi:hypothetical protein
LKLLSRLLGGLRSDVRDTKGVAEPDPGPHVDEVVGHIWVSSFTYDLFDRIGLRHKYRGEPWEAPYPNFRVPQCAVDDLPHMLRYTRGHPVSPELFPEALAIYAAERFPPEHPVSIAGIGYLVHDRLADILRRFDIGPGGLIPHVIYEADEVTPIAEQWWYLGLGAQKRSFPPGRSRKFKTVVDGKGLKDSIYRPWPDRRDDDLTFSTAALEGPDLWAEAELHSCLFMSQPLGQALIDAGLGEVFQLRTALVVA